MQNSVKAYVIAAVNALFGVLVAFGVSLSETRQAAIITFINAALAVWVALTYKNSPAYVQPATTPPPPAP